MGAGGIKGITIEIGGDTTKLDKALSGTNKNSRDLQNELKQVDKLLKLDPKNTELLAQKQELLKKAVSETKDKLDVLRDAEKQVQAQFERGEVSENQYRELQREIIATEENLKGLEKAAKESNITLEKIADATQTIGEKSEALGKELLPISGAIVGVGVASGKMASDFNDAMAKVNTIADTTQVPLDDLSDSILDLSDETGIAATDIADNVYNAISAGQKTGDAVNFVREATTLAKAGFADSASSLDILTTIMNAYGLEASEVTNVSDMLIQTQNLGKTTVAELSGAMGKVIPTANANNVALDQLCAGYSILTAKGVATAESTTYMNAMLNELGKGGTKVDAILREKTGKSFSELSASGVSLGDVLQIIDDEAKNSGKAFSDLWSSSEGAKAGITLLGDGADEFNLRLKEMNDSAGATQTAFEKLDTDSNQAKIALNQLKNSAIDFGTTLMSSLHPMIEKIVAKVKEFTQWFKNLSDSQKENIIKIGALVAAIGPALIVLGKMLQGIASVIGVVTKLKGVLAAAKGAFAAFNAVMAANPIGLIVIAVVGLVAVLVTAYNKCEWFRDMVNEAFAQIKVAIAKAVDQIKPTLEQTGQAFMKLMDSLKPAIQFLSTYFFAVVQGIIAALAPIVAAVKEAVDFVANIISAVMALLKGDFDGFGQYLMAALKNVVDFIRNIVQAVVAYVVAYFAGFGVDIKQVFADIWQGIVAVFAGVGQWFTDRFIEAYTGITNVFSSIGQWFSDKFTEAYNGIIAVFTPIVEWFAPLFEAIKELGSVLCQWISLKFEEAYNDIVAFFTPIGQWFGARWQDVQNALSSVAAWFSAMFQNAYSNVMAAFGAIGQWFAARWQDIQNVFSPIVNWFSTMFQNAYNSIMNAFSPIGSWFSEQYENVTDAFGDIPDFFRNIFDEAWQNIQSAFDGVIDFFTDIRDTIMGFFSGIADAIRGEIEDATNATNNAQSSQGGRRAMPEFARGGILRNGRGIVAEAGPELIEMVNGAAIITPLSGGSNNTPIVAAGGGTEGFRQVNNFYSPKALDPYETARLNRNAARGAVLKLQGV